MQIVITCICVNAIIESTKIRNVLDKIISDDFSKLSLTLAFLTCSM